MRMGKRITGALDRARAAAQRAKNFMLDYAYLMTLGAALTVVAASALYTWQLRQKGEIQATADAPEVQASALPASTPEPLSTAVPLATMAPMGIASTVRLGGTTVRPVSGGALRESDPTAPVYWEALSCFQPHAGLDLAGAQDEEVLLVMDGTVTRTVRDELWGWRVEVAQTDGQTALYAGLAQSLVQEGQHVTRGQAIGTLLGRVPCEAEMGAHLHLELARDGEAQNPQTILP